MKIIRNSAVIVVCSLVLPSLLAVENDGATRNIERVGEVDESTERLAQRFDKLRYGMGPKEVRGLFPKNVRGELTSINWNPTDG